MVSSLHEGCILAENNERAQRRVAGTTCRRTRRPVHRRTPQESLTLRIAFRWSSMRRRSTPMAPAWTFTKRRVPPVSAIAATTSFSAYAVHQSAKGSWHRLRTWAPNGRRESTLSAATPRYRFFGVYRPLRPLVSTVHPSSTPSGRSTCIPSRWWDVERAASSLWLWIRTSSFLINQKLRCQSESK